MKLPLIVGVFEIALGDCEHVVKAEILIVSGQETVLGRLMRHDIGEVEPVLDFGHAPDAGREQDDVGHHGQHFNGRFQQIVTVRLSGKRRQRPASTLLHR